MTGETTEPTTFRGRPIARSCDGYEFTDPLVPCDDERNWMFEQGEAARAIAVLLGDGWGRRPDWPSIEAEIERALRPLV